MKKLLVLLIMVFFTIHLPAQFIVAFHEDFELPSLGDSLQNSSDPVGASPWEITTHLSNSGLRADSNWVAIGSTVYLTTNTFTTVGYSNVSLQFAQICKLFVSDGGVVDVSVDGGTVWTALSNTEYKGAGMLQQGRFCDNSYSDWLPGDTTTKPTNAWWKNETFDISSIAANQASVKIRFKFTGSGNPMAAGRYGWLLDDIKVFAANNELSAPVITFITPIIQDSVSNTGPFFIKAYITDASTIATANLIYNVNGGNDIVVAMTHTDSTYTGEIPSFTYNNTISYKIIAADQYGNQNISNSYSFIIKKAPLIVEIGTGTSNSYYAPIYVSSSSTTYKYSFNASIYTAAEINANGFIKSIAWNKSNSGAYTLGNADFKIYLKEVSNTTAPTTYTNYTTERIGATLVYSSLTQDITANTGWDTYNFNVDSFAYSGQNDLMVFVEFYHPGNATGAINYYYTSTAGKAYTFAGPVDPPAYSYANYLPHIQLGIVSPNFVNDAGISEVSTPSGVIVTTTAVPIKVRVKNYGTEILTKATVHWALDNVYKGSVAWTGNLAQDMVSPEFQVGNTLLSLGAHVIKSWTEMPNDSIDNYASNDTIWASVYVCSQILSGTYTVGTSTADFPTLDGAVNGLMNCGINGPVVFKLKAGTYNQQLTIPVIPGGSNVNTVTFESESGNNADVTIAYAATGTTDNWVVRLDGVNYVKIKNITIDAQGSSYGRGVELANSASHNVIEGCKIIMPSTTSSNYAGIYTYNTLEQYNTYKNNEIHNGYYGIYNYGTSSSVLEKGNVIDGNTITGFYYYGIYSYYQDSTTIDGNIVENGSGSGIVYSMYIYYNDNLVSISKNKINATGTSTAYTMRIYYCDNTAAQPGIIANNFISQSVGTTTVYGLTNYSSTYQNYYYNSVNITAGGTTYGAFYSSGGSNINVINNNFSNTGLGYAYYISTTSAIDNSNYNNLYATGSNLAYWGGAKSDLAALQSASNLEANSISVNPGYISLTDLHVNNPLLNNKGIALLDVTDDIDGDVRNATTPDIGADEFILIANDGGIADMVSPVTACSGSLTNVIFRVKNFGTDTLKSANINWEINGVAQASAILTDTLANLETSDVFCSTYTFMQGTNYNIKAWVSNPNNVIDDNFANDTLTIIDYKTSMSGTYTIGATAADYATINLAVADLVQKGVCGPTVLNILPGTYNENVDIPEIAGNSMQNTITLQSSTGDSTSVIVNYASTGSGDNYVIKLNGADNMIIKNITLANNGGNYSRVIELSSAANHNQILNNIITSSVSTSSTATGIYNGSGNDDYNVFRNNIITNGYYGIYNYGSGSASLEKGTIIEGNSITDFYYYGIYSSYQDSVTIDRNTVENASNSATVYGMYVYYNDNLLSVSKNKIHVTGSGTTYPLRVYYCDNTSAQPGIIANNFISQADGTGSTYGLHNYYSTYQKFYNNSVNITAGASTYGAFYSTGGSNIELYNNNFVNTGSGYAMYISTTAAISSSDYNNLYSTGTNFVYWGGAKADLAAYQASSGKDANSVSIDPAYIGIKDLHTENPLLFGKGTPLAEVTDDIDGELRNAVTPCIGADEFVLLPNDAKVKAIYTLGSLPKVAGSPHVVKTIVENRGLNTLYNLNVNLTISGSNTLTNTQLIDSIHSGTADTISFAGFTPTSFGVNNVKVSVPTDDLLANNELNYMQTITDSIFAYADTSMASSHIGFGNASGLLLTKHYMNANKTISSMDAYITDVNSVGKQLYAVMIKNGLIIDTSATKTIAANDINTWVRFDMLNPPATTTSNNYFYAGIAQVSNSAAYYPLGSQMENPTRTDAFYTADLDGSNMMEATDMGRFMINVNLGTPINDDAALLNVLSPTSGCGLSNELITISIKNKGTDTIFGGQNTLMARYGLKLNGNIINVVSEQVTDTIFPTQTISFTFATPFNMTVVGADSTFRMITWVDLLNDPFSANDTVNKNILSKFVPTAPLVNSPVSINYATSTTLSTIANDTVNWYANLYDTIPFLTDAYFTTPVLYDTTSYWVSKLSNGSAGGSSPNGLRITEINIGGTDALEIQNVSGAAIDATGWVVAVSNAYASINSVNPNLWQLGNMPSGQVLYKDDASSSGQYWGSNLMWNPGAYPSFTGWAMIIDNHGDIVDFLAWGWKSSDIQGFSATINGFPITIGSEWIGDGVIDPASDFIVRETLDNNNLSDFANLTTGSMGTANPNMTGSVAVANGSGCDGIKAMIKVTVANVPLVDAGITQITSPIGSIPSGTNTAITGIVKNWGTNNLTSDSIGWSIDGIVQTPAYWTGNLSSGQSVAYQIANIPFAGGVHTINVWSYQPNGITDLYTMNDTATTTFSACMNGSFTIGVGKDFPSFNTALTALDSAGICGNVVFLVDAGTYNERLSIGAVPGMDANNTVTFTSATGDSTDVVLHYATSSTAAWAIKFNGSSYFTFNKMTLSVSGGNTYGRIMELASSANHITISNCIIEGLPSSSSSNYFALIYANGTGLDHNTFINNVMKDGSYGIYLYGSSTTHNTNNVFSGNIVDGFYYYGIYSYYQDSITISGNTVKNAANSGTVYALYAYYNDNSTFTKNKFDINGSSTAYCMYMYYNNYNGGNSLVANNFVSQSIGTGTVYGLYNYNSSNMNYYHNSVNITGGSSSARAFYSTGGSNNNVVNNNLSNTGGGYAYYVSTPAGINISDYNNMYASGINLAYWSAAKTDLSALIAASEKDSNSISVNPNYFSLTDLHVSNFDLNGKATPLTLVTEDIDGDVRNTTIPDIGADEFNLPNNDAGIFAFTSPVSPAVAGVQTVMVVLKNYGALNLTAVNVQWMVNGVLQTDYPWTGSIVSGGVDTISIGTYNFASGVSSFKVWTNLPNGAIDPFANNDTLVSNIVTCTGSLSGVYTIGGATADYQTVNNAVQSLIYCGVNGPVTLNINPGNYYGQLMIPSINGASAINTITFQSANNDSSSVIINYDPSSNSDNYVVKLDGADYIKFKNLSIINNTQFSLGRVVELANSANYNEFSNNVIQSVISTSSNTAGIYSYNTKDEHNTFANNLITGGYYGIYIYGAGSASGLKEIGNTITNNIIKDFYYYGMYLYYQDSINVIGNEISNASTASTAYGIYSYYVDNNNYQKNKVQLNNSGTTYGIYLYYNNNVSGTTGLIANNFISQAISVGTVYGIYSSTSNNKFYYNSLNITSSGATSRAMYFTGGTMNELKNNSIVNAGAGYAVYTTATAISSSNYNNLFTTGSILGYWGANTSDLAAWKTLSAQDAMSVSFDPDYLNPPDLHVYTPALNNKGMFVPEVVDDIDGQIRSLTTPDIGADEYAPLPIDLGVKTILTPVQLYSVAGGNIEIKCIIKNFGEDSVANFNVVYKAGNAAAVMQLYPTYLLSNKSDTVTFTTLMPVVAGPFEIKVYTSIAGDGKHSNDTLTINYFGVSVKNIPYTENFDNTTEEWFSIDPATLWEKGVPTASVINTAHSSPNVWATKLNGDYAVDLNTSILYTPIFNNIVFKADTLKFWHWISSEPNYDGGYIQYLNASDDWITLGGLLPDTNAVNWYNGQTFIGWADTNAGWQQSKYCIANLADVGNTIQFRLIFTTNPNTNNYNGWAIDDFELTLAPIPQDAGVIAITSPAATSSVGDNVTVTVAVKNFGLDVLSNIPVKYQVGTGPVIADVMAGPLAPGATSAFTFASQPFQVGNQSYEILAYTEAFGDIYIQNDSTKKSVTVIPALNDVGVTEIIVPGDTVGMGGTTSVQVLIKNFGSQTQTALTVGYQRGVQTPVEVPWTGTLLAGATEIFTFPTPMSIPSGSSFSLTAYTKLSNDAYTKNDTLSKSIMICNIGKPGAISGLANVNAGTNNVMYRFAGSVTGAVHYNWVYSGNDVQISDDGNNKDTVYINYGAAATSGTLSVKAWNGNCEGNASELAIVIGVGIDDVNESDFWLGQNIPNPTIGSTNIEYNLPVSGKVKFDIVNLFGQNVYTFDKKSDAGKHSVELNVNDLSAGIYYYSIEFNGKRLVKKMVVNK